MKALIVTLGSHGDVHPFLGIALALRDRGHDVTMLANPFYEPLIRGESIAFCPLGTEEDFLAIARDPDIWHKTRGLAKLGTSVTTATPIIYRALLENLPASQAQRAETVVIHSTLVLAALLVQETHRIPTITMHLSPSIFRSMYETAKYPGLFLPRWLPRRMKRNIFEKGDRYFIDPHFGPGLNAFRKELGLAPVHGILRDYLHSPTCAIGLFPDWFAAPQPDWPPQARLTGFPLYDEGGVTPMPEELRAFLAEGTPPLVFTPGSAMFHGQAFFTAAVDACQRLNRRGVLLSRHTAHIPTPLPAGVLHVPFAPFSAILPHAAALVHHGGIGTTSQALRAGIPQLIMPMSHDQFDNADRVRRLNAGESISRRAFTGRRVARVLKRLLSSAKVAASCRQIALRFDGHPSALERTAQVIEDVAASRNAVGVSDLPSRLSGIRP